MTSALSLIAGAVGATVGVEFAVAEAEIGCAGFRVLALVGIGSVLAIFAKSPLALCGAAAFILWLRTAPAAMARRTKRTITPIQIKVFLLAAGSSTSSAADPPQ